MATSITLPYGQSIFTSYLVFSRRYNQTVLPRQLNLNDRLIPLLNASNQLATNHLLSIALDLPILSQEENLSVNQWRSQVRQWFGLLSQEREALTRHPLPVLFWIPSAILQDFIQYANDLWAWHSAHIEIDIPSTSSISRPSNTDSAIVQALTNAVRETVQVHRLQNLDPSGTFQTYRQVRLKLDEIYISLQMQQDHYTNDTDRKLLKNELAELEERLAKSGLSAEEQEDQRDALLMRSQPQHDASPPLSISLEQAAAQHDHLLILGDPGSGKTTLLRYLALQYAQTYQTDASSNDCQPSIFPILIRIADYADGGVWREKSFIDFLPQYFKRNGCGAQQVADLLNAELERGNCLVLLDGLDEIVDADDRRGIVQQIKEFISATEQGGARGKNHFIITSRIAGYRSAPLGEPFAHYVVEEMDEDQMERFLERWCRAVEDTQTPDLSIDRRQIKAQEEVDGIMNAITHIGTDPPYWRSSAPDADRTLQTGC